jgi:hypothetical protein
MEIANVTWPIEWNKVSPVWIYTKGANTPSLPGTSIQNSNGEAIRLGE